MIECVLRSLSQDQVPSMNASTQHRTSSGYYVTGRFEGLETATHDTIRDLRCSYLILNIAVIVALLES